MYRFIYSYNFQATLLRDGQQCGLTGPHRFDVCGDIGISPPFDRSHKYIYMILTGTFLYPSVDITVTLNVPGIAHNN